LNEPALVPGERVDLGAIDIAGEIPVRLRRVAREQLLEVGRRQALGVLIEESAAVSGHLLSQKPKARKQKPKDESQKPEG